MHRLRCGGNVIRGLKDMDGSPSSPHLLQLQQYPRIAKVWLRFLGKVAVST